MQSRASVTWLVTCSQLETVAERRRDKLRPVTAEDVGSSGAGNVSWSLVDLRIKRL